ncbi:MAG: alanine--glyoxylate aminotransferase family protein [Spirochaetes bacterium]|mgnify:FL=1|nr:alanine--glyoxylate aminotransferase family protein [Spirochaetota bacterium]NLJ04159.1 alanine--glyoxylate aminotransferase family protein [Exilispira sp.]MBP8990441.1 alanine--glyoxylate aminotransferase family protein [Spirochaetota bacterium]HOV45930.1 alanine--glyoxylate aminotransferase family protein [Exilispira sp.]HPO60429.1 alanine--glyoxylate aminotransferase family protein [Exilispira sp.]
MHKKLFVPGPIEVADDVLAAMSTPMIYHRTKEASALQAECAEGMKKIMLTSNTILFSTSSGTGLMEGSIRSCTSKRAIVFSVGAFGKRWYEIAVGNGIPADIYTAPSGEAISPEIVEEYLSTGKYDVMTITHNETSTGIMNPVADLARVWKKYPDVIVLMDCVSSMGGVKIETDALGVDVCLTSSQKALGLPPGLAICSVSNKAIEKARTVKNRGYYFDLIELYKYVAEKEPYNQYPSTPSLSHYYALQHQLKKIEKEGIEKRWERHQQMAEYTRNWAKKYFELYPKKEQWCSVTLTTISNTRNLSVKGLNEELGKRGFMISNGYGDLKEKTFRIAHMGDFTLKDIEEVIGHIEDIWNLK